MKNPKVGDRVRFYWSDNLDPINGEIQSVKGEFCKISGCLNLVHRNCLVRLKKKERPSPKEWWIKFDHFLPTQVCLKKPQDPTGWVHVREVLE